MSGAIALRTVFVASVLLALGCGGSNASQAGSQEAADSGSGSDAGQATVPEKDAAASVEKPVMDAGVLTGGSACSDTTCKAPATCSVVEGRARCTCPSGYDDAQRDGSRCVDRDECAEANGGCDKHAKCTNLPGSFRCECQAPAYAGDGKRCDCRDGYTRVDEQLCLANDGVACDDNLDCTHGHCEGGTCCAQGCGQPAECHTTTGATCSDGKACKYPLAEDGSACDDLKACTAASSCQAGSCIPGVQATNCDDHNPCTDDSCEEPTGCKNQNNTAACDDHNACTQGDRCQAGECLGAGKDCSSADDACNLGDCEPASGACVKKPKSVSASCDDSDSCTLADQCSNGMCVGSGNACGSNALACTRGAPNTCSCAGGFTDNHAGACVPDTDECAIAGVCSTNANCVDPSNAPGDATCSCKPGWKGDGKTCTAVDPCEGNPCGAGRGTCVPGSAGAHTCTCNAGYVVSGATCICDMTGTFATRTWLQATWPQQDQVEGGTDATYSYAIERHSYDAAGKLSLELTLCGQTSLDICGLGLPPVVVPETYTQFQPLEIWGTASMPVIKTKLTVDNPLPGGAFVTDPVAAMTGISLADPLGPWPPSRHDIDGPVGFDGTAVNGAAWLDQDNDAKLGITSYAVPPGGIIADGIAPDPITNFAATSPSCPRSGGTHTPYAYWPAAPDSGSLTPIRIKRFYTAARVISSFKGTIDSCNDISGDVIGPHNGMPQLDSRTGGCVRMLGSDETDCSASVVDALDTVKADGHELIGAKFKAKRVATPVTCAMVRALNFD